MSQQNTLTFSHSAQYWDDRYRLSGNSGAGSYGRLADFKADVLNRFVAQENVQSITEFGCGDGNQLSLAHYPQYTGFDVSEHAVQLCQQRFSNDPTKEFKLVDAWDGEQAELTLSLDVIYHLIEEDTFERYMTTLFKASSRFVAVYASNDEALNTLLGGHVKHVRHRCFTDWLAKNITDRWVLHEFIANQYPFDVRAQNQTSFADFFIFRRWDN
ncbi:MAG: hypothetical protein ACRCWW_17960 [Scandinavium sp.]|uniref:hypothetical protein n=1 Tax=Scandinavium sp. TaxID=2830653 RepID=UPI003F2D5812